MSRDWYIGLLQLNTQKNVWTFFWDGKKLQKCAVGFFKNPFTRISHLSQKKKKEKKIPINKLRNL